MQLLIHIFIKIHLFIDLIDLLFYSKFLYKLLEDHHHLRITLIHIIIDFNYQKMSLNI